ncbi:hypothetical protein HZ994_03200 [Akkermansiaceae bacterium]|nr:hypothetical protein HZ994_03200 [Akkermansiaceae bacterium]
MKALRDFMDPGGVYTQRQYLLANLLLLALAIIAAKAIKGIGMEDPRPAVIPLIVAINSLYGIASSKRFRGLGHSAWWGMAASALPLVGLLLLSSPDKETRIQ